MARRAVERPQRNGAATDEPPSRPGPGWGGELLRLSSATDSASLLAAIVESSDDAIIGKSLDGIVFSWNSGAERLYGYRREEMIGRSISVTVPVERREELRQILGRLAKGERVDHIETVRLRKDGRRLLVSLTISPIIDAAGTIIGASAIARDISRRKRAEAEREALARLKAVFETAVDGIITIDECGLIESVNAAAVRLFGYPADEIVGQNVKMLMPEPYRDEHDSYLGNYLRTGERKIIGIGREVQGRRKDGSVFPVELAVSETRLDGRRIFTGIVRDITTRRRAERALRESRARFAAFMRHLPGAAWLKDLAGRYVYANPEAERVFSTRLEHLRGRKDDEVFPDETARQFRENDQRALQEDDHIETVEVLRQADGMDHHSIVNKFVVRGEDGQPAYVGGVAFDITDRLAAEEALRASEQRFRLMADSAPTLIWMSDTTQRCTWFNRAWLSFTGRTMEQELGDGWIEGVHPDDVERCLQTYRAAFEAREPFEMAYRLRRFDGEYRWIHDAGVPLNYGDGAFVGYIGSCIDITYQKRSEDLLRERVRERTRELTAANQELRDQVEQRRRVESLLASENRILELIATDASVSRVMEEVCATIERLIQGTRCAVRLAHNHSRAGAAAGPAKGAGNTRPVAGIDLFGSLVGPDAAPPIVAERTMTLKLRRRRPDAALARHGIRSYWVEPIVGAGGELLGSIGVYRTSEAAPSPRELELSVAASRLVGIAIDRVRSDERSRQQMAQLAHVARLATMGEMASGLAHELNQPLCAILNFTEARRELVRAGRSEGDELPRTFAEVAAQAQRAGEVIRGLREFVRHREPQRELVDLNGVVREVVGLTSVEARQGEVRVQLKLADPLPRALADRIQMQQVLVNLVRNAFEAMRETAVRRRILTIQTFRRRGPWRSPSAIAGLGWRRKLKRGCLSRSSPPSRRAWGWDCPSAARSSKPTTAESGRRSIGREERRFGSPCPPRGGRTVTQQPTVFIVDDDHAVRESLDLLIRSVGLAAESFPSAQAFLRQYDPGRPGCLVLDVRMPGMSGLELQRHLKERGVCVPVIIITGHGDVPIAVRAMKDGAVEFLEKPFSKQLLLEHVREALSRDGSRREDVAKKSRIEARLALLSPRERQVMELVVAGRVSKQVAADLRISKKTVDVHRARVMQKLNVESLPELVEMVLTARGATGKPAERPKTEQSA